MSAAVESLFDFQTSYFLNFLPMSNIAGELINSSNFATEIVVSANANPKTAWAFIEELLSVTANRGDFEGNSHILRQYAFAHITSGLNTALTQFIPRPIVGSQSNVVNQAAERIASLGDFPIRTPATSLFLQADPFTPERHIEIDNAIRILAEQNEMPVAHIHSFFPSLVSDFIQEPLESLRLGLITTEAATQQIHNSIQLWLLE